MEFLDKLTKKATETYKGAAEKTGKIAKEAKLKLKINDNKSKINEIYQEIGKKVYQKHTANEQLCVKKDLEEECAKIDILSAEIETYHKEILDLSDVKTCVNCKEPIDKEARFCPKCGTEQPKEEAMEVEVISETQEESQTTQNENENEKMQEESEKDGKMNYTEGEDSQNNTSK